jgi:histidinol dehydrogenase
MFYGTKTINKVNKIVGPGNSFVAMAKKSLFGEVGIDMIAGPTDLTIIADKDNNHDFIAADALSQLEHGVDSKSFIIVDDENYVNRIIIFIIPNYN